MQTFLLLSFFNDMVNKLIRDVPDEVRYPLILGLCALAFFFLAKSINPKKDAGDKEPIKYGKLFFAIIFFGLVFIYAFVK
ncbi:MAG: hypothetical protein IJ837_01695 [Clostridia bacterium]|nr:hypothetical protein [Clostridia bacterium]